MVARLFGILFIIAFSAIVEANEVLGFWNTISDETGKPESIVAIYEYQGKYFGRIVATYDDDGKVNDTIENPKERAPGVEGNPYYSGLDILWNLVPKDGKYVDGKILDPEEGKIYGAEMWLQDGKLMVRGEIWVFGRNETWVRSVDSDFPSGFKKPDPTKFVPVISHVIKHRPSNTN